MKAGRVTGRVVATSKYPTLEGKKILLVKPLYWEEVKDAFKNGKIDTVPESRKSLIALDSVGAGAGEYVFYVSSKEAAQAFDGDPICHNAIVGIIDGLSMEIEKDIEDINENIKKVGQ
jgi:microcompartment protein CcmK/EutM